MKLSEYAKSLGKRKTISIIEELSKEEENKKEEKNKKKRIKIKYYP